MLQSNEIIIDIDQTLPAPARSALQQFLSGELGIHETLRSLKAVLPAALALTLAAAALMYVGNNTKSLSAISSDLLMKKLIGISSPELLSAGAFIAGGIGFAAGSTANIALGFSSNYALGKKIINSGYPKDFNGVLISLTKNGFFLLCSSLLLIPYGKAFADIINKLAQTVGISLHPILNFTIAVAFTVPNATNYIVKADTIFGSLLGEDFRKEKLIQLKSLFKLEISPDEERFLKRKQLLKVSDKFLKLTISLQNEIVTKELGGHYIFDENLDISDVLDQIGKKYFGIPLNTQYAEDRGLFFKATQFCVNYPVKWALYLSSGVGIALLVYANFNSSQSAFSEILLYLGLSTNQIDAFFSRLTLTLTSLLGCSFYAGFLSYKNYESIETIVGVLGQLLHLESWDSSAGRVNSVLDIAIGLLGGLISLFASFGPSVILLQDGVEFNVPLALRLLIITYCVFNVNLASMLEKAYGAKASWEISGAKSEGLREFCKQLEQYKKEQPEKSQRERMPLLMTNRNTMFKPDSPPKDSLPVEQDSLAVDPGISVTAACNIL